jgi:hypothetical protein
MTNIHGNHLVSGGCTLPIVVRWPFRLAACAVNPKASSGKSAGDGIPEAGRSSRNQDDATVGFVAVVLKRFGWTRHGSTSSAGQLAWRPYHCASQALLGWDGTAIRSQGYRFGWSSNASE